MTMSSAITAEEVDDGPPSVFASSDPDGEGDGSGSVDGGGTDDCPPPSVNEDHRSREDGTKNPTLQPKKMTTTTTTTVRVSEEGALRFLSVMIERGCFHPREESGADGGAKEEKDDSNAQPTDVLSDVDRKKEEKGENEDDSMEAWRRWKQSHDDRAERWRRRRRRQRHVTAGDGCKSENDGSQFASVSAGDDDDGDVVLTSHPSLSDCVIYTRSGLASELGTILRRSPSSSSPPGFGGRASVSDLARAAGVEDRDAERAAADLCSGSSTSSCSERDNGGVVGGRVERIGLELLTEEYLDGLARKVNDILAGSGSAEISGKEGEDGKGSGRCAVSALATDLFRLPLDATVRIITDRMGDDSGGDGGDKGSGNGDSSSAPILRQDARMIVGSASGARYVVTRDYEKRTMERIVEYFLKEATSPISLMDAAKEYDAEEAFIVQRTRDMCENGTLKGDIRGGAGGKHGEGAEASAMGTGLSSAAGTVYVPHCYVESQRRGVRDFFAANGYVTRTKCESLGVSAGRMAELVQQACPDAVLLSANAMIDSEKILSPVEASILEAASQKTFLDLRTVVPDDLVSNGEDARKILEVALVNIEEGGSSGAEKLNEKELRAPAVRGVNVVSDGEALYFSPGMVNDVRTKLLPPLIEDYGRVRAEEIDQSTTSKKKKKGSYLAGTAVDGGEIISTGGGGSAKGGKGGKKSGGKIGDRGSDDAASGKKVSAKEKRRARKAKKAAATDAKTGGDGASTSAPSSGAVPLRVVAEAVAKAYPDLADVQESHGPLPSDCGNDGDDAPMWRAEEAEENEDGAAVAAGEGGGGRGGGPLYEFCRLALDTPDFRSACSRAVKAELERIAFGTGFQLQGAARVEAVVSAFEDDGCFPDACRLVRMLSRLPEEVRGGGDDTNDELADRLERHFLTGCGADFVRRVTEYCLFKHGVEGEIFSFDPPPEEGEGGIRPGEQDGRDSSRDVIPSFCRPVDLSVRTFRRPYLSCSEVSSEGAREPLPMLRDLLPGNVGVDLARMWTLCGGECYQGGSKILEDGAMRTRPGNFSDFLHHVEESCLSVCGLPFKVMDKKSEKQAMIARKKRLTQSLEDAANGADVLELSVVLLFHRIKNVAVAVGAPGTSTDGKQELYRPVLDLLLAESKVPARVGAKLRELADAVDSSRCPEEDVSDELVECVRSYGLSRDISKITDRR